VKSKGNIFVLGFFGFILIIIGIALISAAVVWGHRNAAVALDEQIKAQYISNQSNYDNMWKKFRR
jgi:hypothetical protein